MRVLLWVIPFSLVILPLSWWINDVSPNDCAEVLEADFGGKRFHFTYAMDMPFELVIDKDGRDLCRAESRFDLLTYNHVARISGTLELDTVVVEGGERFVVGDGLIVHSDLRPGAIIGEGCGVQVMVGQQDARDARDARELNQGITVGHGPYAGWVGIYARSLAP